MELRSPSDDLKTLQAKMQEYIDNGAQLGWLIDPQAQQVEIYQSIHEPVRLDTPKILSGEPILPGFQLDLTNIF